MHEQQPQPTPATAAVEHPVEHDRASERVEEPAIRPRIYVASLSDYNAGRLHGSWLDATQDPEALHRGIQQMLDQSREQVAEDWAIHDHDDFAGIRLSEYEDLAVVSRLARGLASHGRRFAGLVDLLGPADATDEAFTERYLGHYPTVEDYAADLLESCSAAEHLDRLPAPLRPYVQLDHAALARDMQANSEIHVWPDDTGVDVFSAL